MCVERTLEKVTFIAYLGLVGGEVENQVEGLESIIGIAMSDLYVHMYVSPKTGKTKLLLILHHHHHYHPYSCP